MAEGMANEKRQGKAGITSVAYGKRCSGDQSKQELVERDSSEEWNGAWG